MVAGVSVPSRALPPLGGHRVRLGTLLGLVAALVVASNVGTVLAATLVSDHPGVLLALSSRIRHLLLAVAAGIDPGAYFGIGFVRLALPAVAFYLLGLWYGEAGLRWLERQAGGKPASIRWVEQGFARARFPLIVLMPGSNLVCLLSGSAKIRARTFATALGLGITLRLGVFWFLGKALEAPLGVVLDFIQRYQWWIVAAFAVITFLPAFRRASSVVAAAEERGEP